MYTVGLCKLGWISRPKIVISWGEMVDTDIGMSVPTIIDCVPNQVPTKLHFVVFRFLDVWIFSHTVHAKRDL